MSQFIQHRTLYITLGLLFWYSIFLHNILSQTYLPQSFTNDTILSNTLSPYFVTENLTIPKDVTLTVSEGVEIKIDSNVQFIVKGTLRIQGTASEQTLITSIKEDQSWKHIYIYSGSVHLNNVRITNSQGLIASPFGNEVTILNCTIDFPLPPVGDCINIHRLKKIIIENNTITGSDLPGKIDAIELGNSDTCIVNNNHIAHFTDDGIDIGKSYNYVSINNNRIAYCNYGITVGETSYADISGNIIIHCYGGLQSHTGATILAYNNTLYKNRTGIECFHGEDINTPGYATILNTIISRSTDADYTLQDDSSITFSHCLSDQFTLPGDSNILNDPLFIDASNGIFHLSPESPCINAAASTSGSDTNGNKLDIGALEFYGIDSTTSFPVLSQDAYYLPDIKKNPQSRYTVLPNPAKNIINVVSLENSNTYSVSLYNLANMLISRTQTIQNIEQLDLSTQSPGLYIIMIEDKYGIEIFKILKQ